MAKDSLNQSLEDLKTGNLYNPSRDSLGGDEFDDWESSMNDFMDSLDPEDGASVTFNMVDESPSNNGDTIALVDAISKGSQAQIKAQRANIDAMTSIASATLIAKAQKPQGYSETRKTVVEGGSIAGNARKELEAKLGRSVISPFNASNPSFLDNDEN